MGRETHGRPSAVVPDGKPNLSAPAPRLAEGHRTCQASEASEVFCIFPGSRLRHETWRRTTTPWAAAIQQARRDRNHVDDPYAQCLPLGLTRINLRSPFKIVQIAAMTIFLHESNVGNTFRQVFMDGRPLPKLSETEPAWLGILVGRWDGDSFVVESIGFRDRGWLRAEKAHPSSDALHVTERWRRIDIGHLELTITIDDPKAFVRPWTNDSAAAPLSRARWFEQHFCVNGRGMCPAFLREES